MGMVIVAIALCWVLGFDWVLGGWVYELVPGAHRDNSCTFRLCTVYLHRAPEDILLTMSLRILSIGLSRKVISFKDKGLRSSLESRSGLSCYGCGALSLWTVP